MQQMCPYEVLHFLFRILDPQAQLIRLDGGTWIL
jgi:hypothetical protein